MALVGILHEQVLKKHTEGPWDLSVMITYMQNLLTKQQPNRDVKQIPEVYMTV